MTSAAAASQIQRNPANPAKARAFAVDRGFPHHHPVAPSVSRDPTYSVYLSVPVGLDASPVRCLYLALTVCPPVCCHSRSRGRAYVPVSLQIPPYPGTVLYLFAGISVVELGKLQTQQHQK
jgi:hypothetical protein